MMLTFFEFLLCVSYSTKCFILTVSFIIHDNPEKYFYNTIGKEGNRIARGQELVNSKIVILIQISMTPSFMFFLLK